MTTFNKASLLAVCVALVGACIPQSEAPTNKDSGNVQAGDGGLDAAPQPGRDAMSDGDEDSDGAEAGSDEGEGDDGGSECQISCNTPDRSHVSADCTCVPCEGAADCSGFGGAKACDAAKGCVACTVGDLSNCGDGEVCDLTTNSCVGCTESSHCSADLPVCDLSKKECTKCTSDNECSARDNVCDELTGECVQCTKDKREFCPDTAEGKGVCDAKTHTCTDRLPGETVLCGVCVSDLDCAAGSLCVAAPAGAGEMVCQQQFTGIGSCSRPYVGLSDGALTSADGVEARVCTLRVQTTTCAAHRQYSDEERGCGTPGATDPEKDEEGSGESAKCGVEGLDDGSCVLQQTSGKYLCTVPCDATQDCPKGASRCDVGGTDLCTL